MRSLQDKDYDMFEQAIMTESFEKLLNESFDDSIMQPGKIIKGVVEHVGKDFVVVNAGLKSEGIIPVEQFFNDSRELDVEVGDEVDVALDSVEDGHGETRLSREKARRYEAWLELEQAYDDSTSVKGFITGRVKGGFIVEIKTVRAFLPGSLVDIRPVRDPAFFEGKEVELKVIKMDRKRNNIVVSRRSVIEEESSAERQALLENLQEGQEIAGVVKNLTDYGAFIDLGGIDGLLHITDMSWKRIKHPSEIVNVGDEVKVKVIKFDKDKGRVSLGLKQLGDDPWQEIKRRYPENSRIFGRVTNITDYGCFVELEEGVEGLVHVSELDWTNKNIHPSKVVQIDQEVEVMVLDIDEEHRRISLGLKQCVINPWIQFSDKHTSGDKVQGAIKSITDFGVFIGLDGGIDGLVHLSDLSWSEAGEQAVKEYKKGQEVEAMVLSIDPERERVSLGIKQLSSDPYSDYLAEHPKGSIVTGVVEEVDTKVVTIRLAEGIDGILKASDISRERVADARTVMNVGDEVEAKITSHDRKNKGIALSIKAKDVDEEKEAVKSFSKSNQSEQPVSKTLGDLIKAQMEKTKENEK